MMTGRGQNKTMPVQDLCSASAAPQLATSLPRETSTEHQGELEESNLCVLQGIEFLVAPFEADPQLAFLASISPARGGVAAVITEDSDLVAYACPRILFKLTRSASLRIGRGPCGI